MEFRTKKETIKYFEDLALQFSTKAHIEQDPVKKALWMGKSEAYELAAFEIKTNMK